MLSKIVVALDTEGPSSELWQQAIALAQATGAHLKLINVMTFTGDDALTVFAYPGLMGYPDDAATAGWNEYQERQEIRQKKGLKRLHRLSEQASAASVINQVTQEFGSPGPAICQLATSWEADLIIVGSRGRTGLKELFLGSVSNYVMHHAPCSVMVVHPAKSADVQAPELVA